MAGTINVRHLKLHGRILFRQLLPKRFLRHSRRLHRRDKHRLYCIGRIRLLKFLPSWSFLFQVQSGTASYILNPFSFLSISTIADFIVAETFWGRHSSRFVNANACRAGWVNASPVLCFLFPARKSPTSWAGRSVISACKQICRVFYFPR